MASSNNRTSTYTQVSTSSDHDRPKSADAKKDIWSSMLDSVASGKRLPEKNILVLGKLTTAPQCTATNLIAGGTTDSQREFLETLSADDTRKTSDRQSSKQPPIANNFALGYTYHDVLDADHEGMISIEALSMKLHTKIYKIFWPDSLCISSPTLRHFSHRFYSPSLPLRLFRIPLL